jgi:hypothetical protein
VSDSGKTMALTTLSSRARSHPRRPACVADLRDVKPCAS